MPQLKAGIPSLTGFATLRAASAVSSTDSRMQSVGAAENVLGAFLRCNVDLIAVDPANAPTAQREFRLPNRDLVLRQPGPALIVTWNRVEIFWYDPGIDSTGDPIDPGATVPPGEYWLYRASVDFNTGLLVAADAATALPEERLRLGSLPHEGDRVRALLYLKDFTRTVTR